MRHLNAILINQRYKVHVNHYFYLKHHQQKQNHKKYENAFLKIFVNFTYILVHNQMFFNGIIRKYVIRFLPANLYQEQIKLF